MSVVFLLKALKVVESNGRTSKKQTAKMWATSFKQIVLLKLFIGHMLNIDLFVRQN